MHKILFILMLILVGIPVVLAFIVNDLRLVILFTFIGFVFIFIISIVDHFMMEGKIRYLKSLLTNFSSKED